MTWRRPLDGVVVAMHGEQIAEHGGSLGIRDAGMSSAAHARTQNRAVYGEPSVIQLAAAYAFDIIRNHPFVDGNKRTGFLAAYVFLDLHEWELVASEAEVVTALRDLATGEMDEAGFACWLQSKSVIRVAQE